MTDESNLITLTVEQPDQGLFDQSAESLEQAAKYKITTPEAALLAGGDLKHIKWLYKELESKRLAITRPINIALREVNSLFSPAKQWLKEAEGILKTKILDYQNEQERIAQEEQRKADEKARKQREKLEAKAAVARAEEEAARAAAAKAKGDEAKAAAAALAKKQAEKAAKLEEKAEIVQAPVISTTAPEIEGVHTRVTWKAEVTDKAAFIKFIVEQRPDLMGVIEIDQSKLNGYARLLKEDFDMPGVEAKAEKSIAARS